jgi:prevent-host-death family protein
MNQATISYTRNHLSSILDRVRAGETILITDRQRPVARLEPVSGTGAGNPKSASLVRRGLIRPARRRLSVKALRALPLPESSGKGDILSAFLAGREEGR